MTALQLAFRRTFGLHLWSIPLAMTFAAAGAMADEELPPIPEEAVEASEIDAVADEEVVPSTPPSRLPGQNPVQGQKQGLPPEGFPDDSKPITAVKLNISPTRGELPEDHAGPRFALEATDLDPVTLTRQWEIRTCEWEAPMSSHFPLFFEETNLERYGYHYGVLQPVVSGAHFYSSIFVAPYKGYTRCYWCPEYTLGHYRPGNCVPYQWHLYRADAKAAVLYGATIAGGVILVP